LTGKIEELAVSLNFDELYLSSHLPDFYEKLGYILLQKLENGDSLYRKSLLQGTG